MTLPEPTSSPIACDPSPAKTPVGRLAQAPKVARRPRRVAPPTDDEEARKELEARISSAMGPHAPDARLALAVTDNRYTIISVKREKGLFRLRLHHMFLDADSNTVRALGRYVARNDRDASQQLSRFIDIHQEKIRRARRRRRPPVMTMETAGEVHDLHEIYDKLNAEYFDGKIDARITWGQRPLPGAKKRRRSSIKMGSYCLEDRLIRIHPSLDRVFVPRLFVEWVVYHEMLHQKHGVPLIDGRHQFHPPEFLQEEAQYENFERASRWERENLDKLLCY